MCLSGYLLFTGVVRRFLCLVGDVIVLYSEYMLRCYYDDGCVVVFGGAKVVCLFLCFVVRTDLLGVGLVVMFGCIPVVHLWVVHLGLLIFAIFAFGVFSLL